MFLLKKRKEKKILIRICLVPMKNRSWCSLKCSTHLQWSTASSLHHEGKTLHMSCKLPSIIWINHVLIIQSVPYCFCYLPHSILLRPFAKCVVVWCGFWFRLKVWQLSSGQPGESIDLWFGLIKSCYILWLPSVFTLINDAYWFSLHQKSLTHCILCRVWEHECVRPHAHICVEGKKGGALIS